MLTLAELRECIYGQVRRARPEPRVYTCEEAVDAIAAAAGDGYVVCAPIPFGSGVRAALQARGLELVEDAASQAAAAAGRAGRAVLVAYGARFRVLAGGAAAVAVFFGRAQDREVADYLAAHGYDLTAIEMARAGGYAAVIRGRGRAERYGVPDLFAVTGDAGAAEAAAAVLVPEDGYFAFEERRLLAAALAGARGWSEVFGRLEAAMGSADYATARAATSLLARLRAGA